jgi:hypothetical protein
MLGTAANGSLVQLPDVRTLVTAGEHSHIVGGA